MKNNIKNPNVIWITLDHVTFHHYRHLNGALPILDTYQELCRVGTEFTNCKSVHPLCGPARASMLTGVYTHNHKNYRNEKGLADQKIPLINEYLEAGGYKMGYFGKNHSGYEDLKERGIDCINFSDYGTEDNRIHDEYGNPYMTPEYRAYLNRNGMEGITYHQEWRSNIFEHLPNQDYDLMKTDNFNTFSCGTLEPDRTHEVDFLVDEAKRWLLQHKEQPFVLRLDTWGPHHAYQVPAEFADRYINAEEIELPPSFNMEIPDRAAFARDRLQYIKDTICIDNEEGWKHVLKRAYENYTYIDKRLGEFIQWIREIELGESTAILLTADHGDALATKNGIFDKCGDMPEELMEIPMVVYAPWMESGKANQSLVCNLDVVPTILDLLNLPIPQHMNGISLKSIMEGKIPEREALMCEHYGHLEYYSSQRSLYSDGFKYVSTENDVDQLYHIVEDPYEMNNLVTRPEYVERLEKMKRRLMLEQYRYRDTQIYKNQYLNEL